MVLQLFQSNKIYKNNRDPGVDEIGIDPAGPPDSMKFGDRWINSITSQEFLCEDPTFGAQVWSGRSSTSTLKSFIPVVVGSVTPGTGNYANQVGRFEHIGNQVICHLFLNWISHNGTGTLRIIGLPISASQEILSLASFHIQSLSLPLLSLNVFGKISANQIDLVSMISGALESPVNLGNSGLLRSSFVYLV